MSQTKATTALDFPLTGKVFDFGRQFMLAGLGAAEKARADGGKLFDRLVEEGEKVEAQGRKAAEKRANAFKEETTKRGKDLDKAVKDGLAKVLNGLGIPTNDEIEKLSKRVDSLNDSINKLTGQDFSEIAREADSDKAA